MKSYQELKKLLPGLKPEHMPAFHRMVREKRMQQESVIDSPRVPNHRFPNRDQFVAICNATRQKYGALDNDLDGWRDLFCEIQNPLRELDSLSWVIDRLRFGYEFRTALRTKSSGKVEHARNNLRDLWWLYPAEMAAFQDQYRISFGGLTARIIETQAPLTLVSQEFTMTFAPEEI